MESTVLIITRTGYPFGGGEDFLRQSIPMNTRLGLRTIWLAFCDRHQKDYEQTSIEACDEGLLIRQSGGWNLDTMTYWILYVHPLVVHTQGPLAVEVVDLCASLNVPSIVGIHFWTGIITLAPDTGNREILKHVAKHRPASSFPVFQQKATQLYVASTFVLEVINAVCGPTAAHVINPCPLPEKCLRTQDNGKFVTLINCHHLKGGSLLLEMLSQCPEIPFLAVKTEDGSSALDVALQKTHCRLMDHVEDVRKIYDQTRVLLVPSLVDETFGRVMVEAMINGIPMLTTGAGHLRTFLRDAPDLEWLVIPTHTVDAWVCALNRLLRDPVEYERVSLRLKEIYKQRFAFALDPYRQVVAAALPKPCIMFYTIWADQGLGIQVRNYVRVLEAHGYPTCIFAFCSYTGTHAQVAPLEWQHPRVTYSENHREKVTDDEIRAFIHQHKPTCCFIPETVYHRVFEVAWLLQTLNVFTVAIPNVEIVRREELHKHHAFDLVLFNNALCEKVFRDRCFSGNQAHLGFALPTRGNPRLASADSMHFLCLGGLNAFIRKNVHQVAEAFLLADLDARLTITIQSGSRTHGMQLMPPGDPRITIITDALDTTQVEALYRQTDCLVQVSRHEGLGLGFFEAHSWCLPCITLDTPPHNEIYTRETGWLLPVTHHQAQENPSSHITEACFLTSSLAETFKVVHAQFQKEPARWSARRERIAALNEAMIKTFEEHLIAVVENAHPRPRLLS